MPRKTLDERRSRRNRITPIVKKLIGTENSNDLMNEIMNVLTETPMPPRAGRIYVFIYNAKTPNKPYDKNPLVAVTKVFSWGFTGFNYHWNEVRQYTWDEVASGLYEVYSEELSDLRKLPFGFIRSK
jgi:hypothetical protein